MDEKPLDMALAGALTQAMPGIVTEAIKSSLCLALAFSLIISIGYFGQDALLLLVAGTIALPLFGAAWRQGELSWNIGAARIAVLRPSPPPSPDRLLVVSGNVRVDPASRSVSLADVSWLIEHIFVDDWNWARRDLCNPASPISLPSGRLLTEVEYDRIMDVLTSQGIIVGRTERDKGELACTWDEAQARLEELT